MTMKVASLIIPAIITMLALFSPAAHAKTSWMDYFARSETYIFYYDHDESAKDGDILKATVKMIPIRKDFKNTITQQRREAGMTTAGYGDYEYTVQVWEIDLANRLSKTTSSTDYAKGGAVLDASAWPEAAFEPIVPGSVIDKLLYELPSLAPNPKARPTPKPAP